jgi:release factor glutamine methyltransferase
MPVPPLPTVRSLLADAARELGERIDAEMLMADALGQSRSWLFAHADDLVATDGVDAFMSRVARRHAGEPVAYILGHRGFWSFDLAVTPATLIPRPETELLVELALEQLPRDRACRVVDLGTGSGAIALAIARERPLAEVVATDASADALAVAEGNARALGLDRIRFVHGDWLAPLGNAQFELMVSNPRMSRPGMNISARAIFAMSRSLPWRQALTDWTISAASWPTHRYAWRLAAGSCSSMAGTRARRFVHCSMRIGAPP